MLKFESFLPFFTFVLSICIYLYRIRVIQIHNLNRNIMKKSTQIKLGLFIASYFVVRILAQVIFHV